MIRLLANPRSRPCSMSGVTAPACQSPSRLPLAIDRIKADPQSALAMTYPDTHLPTLIVDMRDGAMVYANWPGRQMLERGQFVRSRGGRIDLGSPEANATFRSQMRIATDRPETTRHFAHYTEHGACTITVAPVGEPLRRMIGHGSDGIDGSNLVTITLSTSLDLPDPAALAAVGAAFGLSPAEARLLPLFMQGATLAEIARGHQLALATVRQHMKAIMHKTGCKRQVDLAIMLTRLCR